MNEQEKILKALHLLKSICLQNTNCENCPFFLPNEEECGVRCKDPCNYDIVLEKEIIWRAFEEEVK